MATPTVHTLLVRDSAVPTHDAWLAPTEHEVLHRLRFAKRRHDWRLGRWTVKQALVSRGMVAAESVATIEVRAADDGAPELFTTDGRLAIPVSISHRGPWGLAALGTPTMRLGCDLEQVEPKSDTFLRDYFTPAELLLARAAGANRDRIAMVIWAGKEAALKAVRTGLRRDTRSMEVTLEAPIRAGWHGIRVRDHEAGLTLRGAWRSHDDYVFSVVSDPPVDVPRELSAPATRP